VNRKLVFVMALTVAFVSLLDIQSAYAPAERTVGVSVGDWAEYSFFYSGNDVMPPPEEMLEWMNIVVEKISGTNVTFSGVRRFADGREEPGTAWVDVDTGGPAMGSLIAANLNEGDVIYTSPSPGYFVGARINETVFREYLGESVEVNHLNLTYNPTIPGHTLIHSLNYFWNRATGLMLEMSLYSLEDTIWYEIRTEIVDTNIEPPSWCADLAGRSAWPEHRRYRISRDENEHLTLYAKVKNPGNQAVWVKVIFNLAEREGSNSVVETEEVLMTQGESVELSTDFGPLTGEDTGKYHVSARCWYSRDKTEWAQGEKEKTFRFVITS